MKNIIIQFICLFFAVNAHSQIPKNCKTIIVKNVGFNEVCNLLLDSGYIIERKDNDIKTLVTEMKPYGKKFNAAYKINVRIKDSIAYISGYFTAPYDKFTMQLIQGNTVPLFDNEPVIAALDKKGELKMNTLTGFAFSKILLLAESFKKQIEFLKP